MQLGHHWGFGLRRAAWRRIQAFLPAWWGWVAWAVMIVAFGLTVYTGVDYLLAARKTRAAYFAAHPEEKK